MLMFSLEPAHLFARPLADALNVALSPHEERGFEDGERKLHPLADTSAVRRKLQMVSVATLFAEAVHASHAAWRC